MPPAVSASISVCSAATPAMPEPHPRTVLAFDYGERKIGVASGQSLTASANPLATLPCHNGQLPWPALQALIREWQPDAVVVGLPLNMDGSDSPISQRARRFARQLHGRFAVSVVMVDERLSSREARAELGGSLRPGGDPRVDSLAAALMIESYFRDGGVPP